MRRTDRLVAFVLAVSSACSGCGSSANDATVRANAASGSSQTGPGLQMLERNPAGVSRILNALETAVSEIPRDTFDPAIVAQKVGTEPAALLDWVKQNTFWVPYTGALRGASGVLMDRLGSSLDRSLLLAELLRTAGHTVRLATRTLSATAAAQLIANLPAAPAKIPGAELQAPPEPSEADYARYAELSGLGAATLKAGLEAVRTRTAAIANDVQQRVAKQSAFLGSAVPPAPSKEDASRAIVAMKELWWVQVQQGEGWSDLDPLAARTAGRHEPPEQTFDYVPDQAAAIPLPDRYVHQLTIRVVVEQSTPTGRVEHVALAHTLRPSEVVGHAIALRNIPRDWPAPQALLADGGLSTTVVKESALKQTEWLPSLSVGDTTIEQASVTMAGSLNAQPRQAKDQRPSAGALGGGLDALGGGDETPTGDEGRLTAEWIEYEIKAPGAPIKKVRREIFDLVGVEARSAGQKDISALDEHGRMVRALAMLGTVEILPMSSRLSPEFTLFRSLQTLNSIRDALTGLSTDLAAHNRGPAFEHGMGLRPTSDRLFDFAFARFAWSPVAADVYLASPNVVTFRTGLTADASGQLIEQRGFDIVINTVAVRNGSPMSSFLARLTQGVTDTNVEAGLAGTTPVSNAGTALANRPDAGAWITTRGPEDSRLSQAGWPAQSMARLKEAWADGAYTVVPSSPAQAPADRVWWRVDPSTGETVGTGELGWGQGLTEKITVTALVFISGGWGTFLVCGNIQQWRGEKDFVGKCACAGLAGGAIAGGAVTAGVGGLVAAMAIAGMLKEAICV
jgi:hypothetical protein